MMAAIKIAGDLITLQSTTKTDTASDTLSTVDSEEISKLHGEIRSLENQVDNLMQTLSLPGSPRPIVP